VALDKKKLWELNLEAFLLDVVQALQIAGGDRNRGYRSPDYRSLAAQGVRLLKEANFLKTMEEEV